MLRWHWLRVGLAQLQELERTFLIIGAALVSGSFFAGGNYGYRGIYLLFALPGVLAMSRTTDSKHLRLVAIVAYGLIIALMWAGLVTWSESLSYQWGLVRLISWLGAQIIWWLVATLFLAIVVGCCLNWLEVAVERPLLRWRQGKE